MGPNKIQLKQPDEISGTHDLRQGLGNLIHTRLIESRMATENHIEKNICRIRTIMDDEKQTLFRHGKDRKFGSLMIGPIMN